MGRKPSTEAGLEPVTVHFEKGMTAKIDTTLSRTESRSAFIRAAVERELKRRERAAEKNRKGE